MSDAVTVSARYRITIPKRIRDHLNLKPGRQVTFLLKHGTVTMVPVLSIEELQNMCRGMSIDEYREETDRF